MPYFILADAGEPDVSTLTNVLAFLRSMFTTIVTMLGSLVDTITGTPLLFISVVVGFAGALIVASLGILRRLGVGGSGRRRARGRR